MIPLFHFGAPRTDCEFVSRTLGGIVTTKNGERSEEPPAGRIIHQLGVRWWLGISSPYRPRWFFGIIIWERKP